MRNRPWVQYWYFVEREMSSAWVVVGVSRGRSRACRRHLVTSAHIIKHLICTSTGSDSVIVEAKNHVSSISSLLNNGEGKAVMSVCLLSVQAIIFVDAAWRIANGCAKRAWCDKAWTLLIVWNHMLLNGLWFNQCPLPIFSCSSHFWVFLFNWQLSSLLNV